MIMSFRKSLQAALVAAIFCQLSYSVESHCFNPDGSYAHPGHYIPGCFHPTTTSPAPTDSPAPSPSPSEAPTDTQRPSSSLAPSSTPTDAPTTSKPSSSPSAAPTASPAPSPSPSRAPSESPTKSAAPSDRPSMNPSESPSKQPSASPSDSPSMNPSESPSKQPSASPTTSSPSESPTGPIVLTVSGIEFVFQNVTGDREMSEQNIQLLETQTTSYLQSHVDEAPGAFSIEVDSAIVTDQNFLKYEISESIAGNDTQIDLIITIDVVVSVIVNRSESLMLNEFFEEFFEMTVHKNALRDMMERDVSFAYGIFTKITESPTQSPTKSPIDSSTESSIESSVDSSKSKKKEKKPPNRTAIIFSILTVIAVFVGSWLLWMWYQARQDDESADLKSIFNFFPKLWMWYQARQDDESEDLKLESAGTDSKSYDSDDRRLSISNFFPKRDIESADSNEQSENSVNEDGKERKSNLTPLMYVPTLMPTESNIEVPDTPGTNLAVSGFATPSCCATPSSVAGFMNAFVTPKSTKSGNFASFGSSKLLGQTPDSEESKVSKAKANTPTTSNPIKKIPLPPKSLAPPKSPYRRETKDQDNGSSMFSGVGVVAGKNNIYDSGKKKVTQAEMILQDLPMEIGGPSVEQKPKAKLPRPKVAIPTQEEIVVFRPPSGRKGTRYGYSPRPNPHPRRKSGGGSAKPSTRPKEKDHSVVDVVDEIAYLYSSNDPKK